MPLAVPPPKEPRFGAKLALSRVHWVRSERVAEIPYLSWPEDSLLRQTVFVASTRRQTGDRGPAREARGNPRNGGLVSRAICQKNRMDRDSLSA
jgi:hypothetical protein